HIVKLYPVGRYNDVRYLDRAVFGEHPPRDRDDWHAGCHEERVRLVRHWHPCRDRLLYPGHGDAERGKLGDVAARPWLVVRVGDRGAGHEVQRVTGDRYLLRLSPGVEDEVSLQDRHVLGDGE